MAFAAEARRAEGQFRSLKSTLNKLKSLKFRFGTLWTTTTTTTTTISTELNIFSQAILLILCAEQIYYGGGLKFRYQRLPAHICVTETNVAQTVW